MAAFEVLNLVPAHSRTLTELFLGHVRVNAKQTDAVRQEYSATDPPCCLRFLTRGTTNRFRTGWWPLRRYLDRLEEALASELRENRNLCAHNAASDADDTYRAIDTMQRLATAIKDKKAVGELGARRNGVRIIQERKEDQAQSSPTAPQGTPPPPW